MAEILAIDKNLLKNDSKIYEVLFPQIKSLLCSEYNLISNLSNFTAALKEAFEKISWIGFYIWDGGKLYLGPFQGKLACASIEIGKGVCGSSALRMETIIVPDVEKFPGHIACDSASKSEIVIPIVKNNKLWGVLDIDSTEYNSFNDVDKNYLELFVDFLVSEIL